MLALERVLLVLVVAVTVLSSATVSDISLRVLSVSLDIFLVHAVENTNAELDIGEQLVASALGEIFTDNNTKHLEILRVRSHGVCRDNPRAASQLMSNSEFIVVLSSLWVETEGDKGKAFAVLLRHDDEA